MELKDKLTHLRKEKGLSQLELAEALRVSRQAVSRWENGLSAPSMAKLKGLSELYGVSLDALLSDTSEETQGLSIEKPDIEILDVECKKTTRHTHKRLLLWAVIVICIAMLIVAIAISAAKKYKTDNYIVMSDIEPEETVFISPDNFSVTW